MVYRWLPFVILLASCAVSSRTVQLKPELLANWTKQLRDSQTDDPFLLVYRKGNARVIIVAAQHDNDPDSKTFALIRDAFTLWKIDSVIVEGFASEAGPDARPLLALATEALDSDGKQPNGEVVPAVRSAVQMGSKILGGEPSDRDVLRVAKRNGVKSEDVLGFYVLRVIPQWLRDGSLTSTRDPRLANLVEQQLARSARDLGLADQPLSGFASWAQWYRSTNGKPIDAGIDIEEAGPLSDGPWPTNRIASAISKARDAHVLHFVNDQISGGQSALVVFGGSHALILRPALDQGLGQPCYVGSDVSKAKQRCLT